jgi:hypothetical protein
MADALRPRRTVACTIGRALASAGLSAAAAGTTLLVTAAPASAHHGFTGEYDVASPLYVQGTVESATYGYPHGLIDITPGAPTTAPADLTRLTAPQLANLGGADVVTDAAPVRAQGDGRLTLLLPPPMTTEVADRGDRPEAGDQVGAVVFRECTTGELRVQLLRISDQEHVVRSGVMQTEVQGCPGNGATASGTASSQPGTAAPDEAAESAPVTVATQQEQDGASWPVVTGLALVAAIGTGAALVVAARSGKDAS